MTWWEAALLGLVQGLTEFLPVSSSGHLVLGQYVLGLNTEGAGDVTFEVFVHFGTVLSIFVVYWKRILELIASFFAGLIRPAEWQKRFNEDDNFRMALFILVTMIPTGITYIFLKDWLESAFADPRFAAGMLLVTGTFLMLTLLRKHPTGNLSTGKSFLIGVAQSFAMMPGVSRSGSTICTAIYLNVDRQKAADFSFLMLLPVVIGATMLKTKDMIEADVAIDWMPLILGAFVAFVSGIWAIKVVIDFVKKGNLYYFAYYCFIVGTVGLIFI